MASKKSKAKIGHSLQDLEDGLILTLQDRPILEGDQLNQSEDVFQNQEKRKIHETQHNRQIKQKLNTISNAATSHLEAKNQGQKGLLPHYDDYSYKPQQIELDDGIISKKTKPKPKIGVSNDFQVSKQNINSQYFTKRFKNRKQEKTNTAELLNFLNQTAEEKDQSAQISKSANQIINQSLDTVRKRRKLQRQPINSQIPNIMNEDDQMLAKAIKRTRKKQLQSNLLDIIKEEGEQNEGNNNYTELQLNPVNYRPVSKQIEMNKKFQIKDAVKGTTSCLFVNLPSEKLVKKEEEEILPQSFKELTEQELLKMKEEVSFLQDKSLGMGMADTLKYLREHNMLGKQEQFGRTKDRQGNFNNPEDRIKLQYRNANGKLMKPKQAFRYLSAIFHGHGPGKNKIEKMKKKQLLEMRMKETASKNEGKLLGLLEKHQEKTGQAHMVINFGGKNKEQK